MKRDRNCGMPMYPMPMMAPTMPYYSQDNNKLVDQIMNLEKRVARLEGMITNQPNYQESNFYMV